MEASGAVTQILNRLETGDSQAAIELFPIVYDELRRLAKWKLADEKSGQTLQTTALVNEVYLRLVGNKIEIRYQSRKCFFVAASEAMRHILVDIARRKLALKRGKGMKYEVAELDAILIARPQELVDVHEALAAYALHDPDGAELVKLHFFGGYSLAEAAELLDISRATANRWWIYAKAWLRDWIENQTFPVHTE